MSPDDPRHGERRGYYAHRKDGEDACDACKRAAAAAEARRQLVLLRGRSGRIDATGTARRLQALTFLGYNWHYLGQQIGSDEVMIKRWAERTDPGTYVYADTARRVADAFKRLSMRLPVEQTPAERNAASRARGRARRNGWLPPLAWDDIDNPKEKPRHAVEMRTTWPADELLAEVRHLTLLGVSMHHAAKQLGVSEHAIEKAAERVARRGAA